MQRPVVDVLVFLGKPGAGKDTVVGNGVEQAGYFVFSSSKAIHYVKGKDDYIKEQVDRYLGTEKNIPDDLMTIIMERYRDEEAPEDQDLALVGFPRSVEQVHFLFEIFSGPHYRIIIFDLDIPDEVGFQRILAGKRLDASGKPRADDDPAIVLKRMKGHNSVYDDIKKTIREFMRPQDKFVRINATGEPLKVASDVLKHLPKVPKVQEVAEQQLAEQ